MAGQGDGGSEADGTASGPAQPVLDEGLSNERTALAWQRTALSLLIGAAIMVRLTFDRLGPGAAVPLVLAAVLAGWVFVESRFRYHDGPDQRRRTRARGGRAAFALALSTTLIAATEIGALIAG